MTNSVSKSSGANLEFVTIGFDNLTAGTVVSDQFDGVSILAQRAEDGGLSSASENDAMIFDTANPTGGDDDLFTNTQGSALIISEDNDSTDPDDEAHGGDIQFKFDNPAYIEDLKIIDTEHGGMIRAYDMSGDLVAEVKIPTGSDGEVRPFFVGAENVAELVITFNSSGAVDDLRYVPGEEPQPETASVGGTVFLDRNDDAIENAGDTTIKSVEVILITSKGAEVARTTTDAEGNYLFEDVAAGTGYRVLFGDVEGTTFVAKDIGGDDTIDSDVDATSTGATTDRFDLAAGEDKRDLDAGVALVDTATAAISGTYFMDNNDNAIEDAGDMAVADATVYLLSDGAVVATTTTDASGNYVFECLKAGTYQVRFDAQEGKDFVAADAGVDEAADSDVTVLELDANQTVESGLTNTVELAIGEHRPHVDAGVAAPAPVLGSIAGRAFCDLDADGLDNQTTTTVTGEELIVNGDFANHGVVGRSWGTAKEIEGWTATTGDIEIQLGDHQTGNAAGNEVVELDAHENATIVQTVNLTEEGTYSFSIDYAMRGTNAATNGVAVYLGGALIAELKPTEPGMQTFAVDLDLPAGETLLEIKGIGISDSIGTVIDNVSLQQTSTTTDASKGKEGLAVTLLDADGNVVATTTTDADGNYLFDDIAEGDYQVSFAPIEGMEATLQNVGDDDTIDSDGAETQTGDIRVDVSLSEGENVTDVDQGYTEAEAPFIFNGCTFQAQNHNSEIIMGSHEINYGLWLNDIVESGARTVFDFEDPRSAVYITIDGDVVTVKGTSVALTQQPDGSYAEEGTFTLDFAYDNVGTLVDDNDLGLSPDFDGQYGGTITRLDANGHAVETFDYTNKSGTFGGVTHSLRVGDGFSDEGGPWQKPGISVDGWFTGQSGNHNGDFHFTLGDKVDPTGSISGVVFMDNNDNSVEDDGDMRIADVEVTLQTEAGDVVATTTTDENGAYLFEGIDPGAYRVVFPTAVDGKVLVEDNVGGNNAIDSDAASDNGITGTVNLGIGQHITDVDAGLELADKGTAALEGRVFMDVNDDSLDNAEMGVEGVEVTLQTAAGDIVATTTTGEDGAYAFEGLDAGGYRVVFPTDVDGKTLVEENVGSDNTIDSDAVAATGITGQVNLSIGERITDIDAGLELVDPANASLAGRVFLDANQDDVDNAETGVAGVVVDLLDADGELVDTTVTLDDGSYSFTDLAAGDYVVDFPTEVDGLTIVGQNAGADDAIDSDASEVTGKTDVISLAMGEQSIDNDAGLELVDPANASLAGRVFLDANQDDVDNAETGVAGVVVDLLDADGELVDTTVTLDDGSYSFTDLAAGDYVVDFPTEVDGLTIVGQNAGADDAIDSDASEVTGKTDVISLAMGEQSIDNDAGLELVDPANASLAGRVFLDANQDDVDNAETGVAGVVVDLLDADGELVDTTVTLDDGSYSFTDLAAGDYVVDFPTEVDGLTIVGQNAGADDAIDSDASEVTGKTDVISLAMGEQSIDNDAGLELVDPANASLAGRVFLDANQDDVDNAETGVAGVVVDLLDADGELVDTTVTLDDGSYSFTDLAAGDYVVDFPTEVDGLTIVGQNAGADDAIDSDASEVTGKTDVISLAMGEQSIDNDAGLEAVDTGDASLAGRIFLDANDNKVDNAETGVGGIAVLLLNATGGVVGETTTAPNGSYVFNNLSAGTYSVLFPTDLDTLKLVDSNAGNNDAIDSDANPSNGRTANVDLAIGEAVTDIDAGFVSYDPIVGSDSGKICADKLLTINVLSNDTDAEALTITEVGGKAISDGQTVTIAGVNVTLQDDKLVFDGKTAFADLNVGDEGTARISYTVSDGNGGEATANVDLTFCGVADTLVEMHASLPEIASFQVLGDDLDKKIEGEAYSIILNNTGDARFDGKLFEQAYCISLLDPVVYAEVAKDSPSYEGELSGGDSFVFNANQISFANGETAGDNLDLINWILNEDYSNENPGRFNDWEVQRAIWELTDSYDTSVLDNVDRNYGQDADVDWIVQQAVKNGEGFVAGKGDIASMIVDPGDSNAEHTQPFIIAFDFDSNDCIC